MCNEKKAIRNAKARARFAALSFEEKEKNRKRVRDYCRSKSKGLEWRRRKQHNDQNRDKTEIIRKSCALHKKWNDATLGRLNHGKKWTEQEIDMIWDTSCTTRELSEKLQRSFKSISTARHRYASKAPEGYRHNGNRKADLSL